MHGADWACPIEEMGYAPGFEPPSLGGAVSRDRETWNEYMRSWRARKKAKEAHAANEAAAARPADIEGDDDTGGGDGSVR